MFFTGGLKGKRILGLSGGGGGDAAVKINYSDQILIEN